MPFVREGSGGEGREVKEGVVRGRGSRGIWGQEEGGEDIQKEGSYQRNEPGKFLECTHGLFSSFPDINTEMNKADLSDKTAP